MKFEFICVATLLLAAGPVHADGFDPRTERLPNNFRGNDVAAIISAIEKIDKASAKGEFETTAQFEARLSEVKDRPIGHRLHLSDCIAFLLPPEHDTAIKYDADEATLHVDWMPSVVGSVYNPKEKMALVSARTKPLGKYLAANAFNRKVVVERVAATKTGVVFESHSVLPELNARITIAPDAARALKGSLRLLIIGTLRPPYVDRETTSQAPTIDHPMEFITTTTALRINAADVWLVNVKTGEILRKVTLASVEGCAMPNG